MLEQIIDEKDKVFDINVTFLNAMNYRKLLDFEKAAEHYLSFMKMTELVNKRDTHILRHATWGLLLLPLYDNRRKVFQIVKNLQMMIEFYSTKIKEDTISQYYHFPTKTWSFLSPAVEQLQKLKFFERFDAEKLTEIMPKFVLTKYK